jgi:hypothetical protein
MWIDFWATDYLHIMAHPSGIVTRYKSTGLRPYLNRVKDATQREVETAISESIFEHGSHLEMPHRTAPFLRLARFLFLVAATAISAAGAELKWETIQQWEDYIKAADTRHADRLIQGSFLSSDEVAGLTTKLRKGGVVVTPPSQQVPLKVQSGLIHDWKGAAFIPKAKLDEVLLVLRAIATRITPQDGSRS